MSKITIDLAVAQQALEALEALKWKGLPSFVEDATTALRRALAEPEQDKRATVADLRDAMWLDPECADKGACQSLKFKCLAKPEQEPVATAAEVHMSRYTIEWTNGPLPEGTTPYTAPTPQPDTDCHLQGICQRSGYSIAPARLRPQYDEQEMLQRCPHFDDPMRREMWITGFKAAHGITGEGA